MFEGAPWNGSTLALIAAAKAHCELQLGRTFFEALQVRAAAPLLGRAKVAAYLGRTRGPPAKLQRRPSVLSARLQAPPPANAPAKRWGPEARHSASACPALAAMHPG